MRRKPFITAAIAVLSLAALASGEAAAKNSMGSGSSHRIDPGFGRSGRIDPGLNSHNPKLGKTIGLVDRDVFRLRAHCYHRQHSVVCY